MLKALGFDETAVLDSGFDKWQAEGRPVEIGLPKGDPPASCVATPRPGRFVDKEAVLAASGQLNFVTVNALGPQFHLGVEPSRYRRPGRIPGSVNVPAASLVDRETQAFATLDDAAAKFAAAGVRPDRHPIVYWRRQIGQPSICFCCISSVSTT
jgi:thiosulfate/3-mercaptopyruvate sulfurtransferase